MINLNKLINITFTMKDSITRKKKKRERKRNPTRVPQWQLLSRFSTTEEMGSCLRWDFFLSICNRAL